MGMIINIDQGLKNRSDYNILAEPLHKMMMDEQEAFEKENPIDFLFVRNSISTFQEVYSSSIGFAKAFSETSDYALGPIFNKAEGFTATYRTRTFQGTFIITQQVLEDRQLGTIKDDASQFVRRWNGDVVEYCMASMDAGFGIEVAWAGGDGKVSRLYLESADTTDGYIHTATKNPLFSVTHKTVKREDGTGGISQSNMFYANVDIAGSEPNRVSALADVIDQVITRMENLKDDNGKYAGVQGAKTIVAANDPHLKAAINAALSSEIFCQGETEYPNPAYKRCDAKFTPYLNDNEATKDGYGFFIVDKGYNAKNHGLELTERIAFTLDAIWNDRPKGVIYDGRQRFDVNVATWRGIAYVRIKMYTLAGTEGALKTYLNKTDSVGDGSGTAHYTVLTPLATIVKSVSVAGKVTTETTVKNTETNPVPTTVVT